MAQTQTRRKRRRKISWKRVLFIVLVVWISYSFGKGFIRNYQLQQDILTLQREISAVELRNTELHKEVERLHSPEYVERVAREELGLVKPGEKLYILSQPLETESE